MKLDELKSSWKQSGDSLKSRSELEAMTEIKNHPKLRRIRIKLMIEVILLTALLLTYRDIFDGAEKPLWANVLLISGAVLFVLNDIRGYALTKSPMASVNIVESIERMRVKLKRLSFYSILSTLIFGASVILFFISSIEMSTEKYWIVGGMGLTLIIMTYIAYKNWLMRIAHFEQTKREFEEV